jgi:hypothetical protein
MKTLPEVKPRELLSNPIHIRLTDSDYNQIKARAEQVNLSMSDFMRRAALRRTMPRPLAAFDLKAYQVLCKIDAQLRIAETTSIRWLKLPIVLWHWENQLLSIQDS